MLFKIWWLVRREAMNRVNVHQPLLIMINLCEYGHRPNLGYQFGITNLVIFSVEIIHFGGSIILTQSHVCIHNLEVLDYNRRRIWSYNQVGEMTCNLYTSSNKKQGGHGYCTWPSTLQHPWVLKLQLVHQGISKRYTKKCWVFYKNTKFNKYIFVVKQCNKHVPELFFLRQGRSHPNHRSSDVQLQHESFWQEAKWDQRKCSQNGHKDLVVNWEYMV